MSSTSRSRARLSDAERAERRARDRELTVRAVAQLRTSAGWQAWLRVRARTGLRRYSLRNQLLIALQDPDATRVAGFRAWLALGYCVRKGETLPDPRLGALRTVQASKLQAWRDAGADPAEKPKAFYRLEAGLRPRPGRPAPAARRRRRRWIRRSRRSPATRSPGRSPSSSAFADGLGVTVEHGADARRLRRLLPTRASGGSRSTPRIAVNQQAAALVHELAHALVRLDHHDGRPGAGLRHRGARGRVGRVHRLRVPRPRHRRQLGPVPRRLERARPREDAFERIAGLVDRLARRLEDALPDRARRAARTRPRPTVSEAA